MSRQITGTVKWFNPDKAYGFITAETGEDVFVHRTNIADGRPWLVEGQGVEFSIAPGLKGPEAREVRVTREVAEAPEWRQPAHARAGSGAAHGGRAYGEGGFRRSREPYQGPLPLGAARATVQRVDPDGRFLFVRLDEEGVDVYVHASLVQRAGLLPREGDPVQVTVEASERGPRARSIAAA
jgi:cold shock protein